MAKEIKKIFCTIESRAGAIAVEHVQLLIRIRFCTIPARPFIQVIYGIRYIYAIYCENILLAATLGMVILFLDLGSYSKHIVHSKARSFTIVVESAPKLDDNLFFRPFNMNAHPIY
jgi:hypothetical protein